MTENVKVVDLKNTDLKSYKTHVADCVILTHDQKLFLQYRPKHWKTSPDCLNIFGGHVEKDEPIDHALKREIKEETGGLIKDGTFQFIGAITEAWTNHTEVVHIYFWHDRDHTITGCYEAEARTFDTVEDVLNHPKVMDYTIWALQECQRLKLL